MRRTLGEWRSVGYGEEIRGVEETRGMEECGVRGGF